MALSSRTWLLILLIGLICFTSKAHAFGAGNIASISAVEGRNWRHGDLEDVLKTVACIRHHKWTSMMIKRVYFGNWLRDYSQAMDTGALKKAQPETIRVLVWLLSFLGFGYATAEFEVTSERLGVYRPEEHIDNPKDYNDNEDARKFDQRLRGPVRQIELDIDQETGMKNYIANNKGDWATSAAFVKYSFERSIHYGRLYTNGHGLFKGKDEDLAEALRCLGQGLHTLEDFGAHTNYVELAMIELGYHSVFPHVGASAGINLRGKHVYPLVTGTFGMVDFYHSVLGEATDHFTQSEVNEMDNAMGMAEQAASSSNPLMSLVKLLSKVPGTKDLCDEANRLQSFSSAQAQSNSSGGGYRSIDEFQGSGTRGMDDWQDSSRGTTTQWDHPQGGFQPQGQDMGWNQGQQQHQGQQNWGQPPQQGWNQQNAQFNQAQHPQSFNMADQYPSQQNQWQGQQNLHPTPSHPQDPQINPQPTPAQPLQTPSSAPQGIPGMPNFDPAKTMQQIYPILAFRDKVVRNISAVIEKIPGLESLVEKITETLTIFVLSLLAPFVRPVLNGISKLLQSGSSEVIDSSGKHQYEVWTNPQSSDPTHSMLSKDHFSNILNEPAGNVAAEILKFIAPRVLYAWEHPDVPVEQVTRDVESIFHHPVCRNESVEVHRTMFQAVAKWVNTQNRGNLESVLSSDGVRNGKNHKAGVNEHAQVQHHAYPQQKPAQHGGINVGGYNVPMPAAVQSYMPHMPQMPHIPGTGAAHGGGGHGGSSNPLGMVGDMIGSFTGSGQHGGSGYSSHGSSNQGGLGGMLNMASKLPIPGVQGFANDVNKFGKLLPGGFGGFGGGFRDIGGARELNDAAKNADYNPGRSPSPTPLAPPTGYEQYSQLQRGNSSYGPRPGEEGQYTAPGGAANTYYQGGGASDSYYRS